MRYNRLEEKIGMKVLFSAFTGYNFRELLLPLSPLLDEDADISEVLVVSPGGPYRQQLFPDLGRKYTFLAEGKNESGYKQLLAAHRPNIVITPTAGLEPKDIPLIQAAKHAGIPTLTFVASWDNVYKMERVMTLKKYQSRYALADHFAVWNKINSDHLLRIVPELTPTQVTITGPPRLDYLADEATIPSRAELLARLDLPADGKKLVHLATTELYPSDYLVKALAAARGSLIREGFHLLVSVHPGGELAAHEQYAAPYGARVFYSFGRRDTSPLAEFRYAPTLADLHFHAALFKHSDLLINHSSTVIIESLVADTPVVTVKYGRPLDWWRWHHSMVYRDFKQHAKIIVESDATRVIHNSTQLIEAAGAYLHNPTQDATERRALARRLITNTSGNAGKQLLDLIKKITTVKPSL
jgi:hypothetical protein